MRLAVLAVLPSLVVAHDVLRERHHDFVARQAPSSSSSSVSVTISSTTTTSSSSIAAQSTSTSVASPPVSPAPGSTTGPTSSTSSISPPPASTPPVGTASPPPSGSPPPSVSFSLLSTNPTAVPVSDITSGTPPIVTIPLFTTFAAGSTPSAIPNAPPLPNLSGIIPSNYPPLDKVPDTTSPEVQQWISEVQNSGIAIPNIAPTVGSAACSANPAAAANTSICWWTCGGCTRNTDIVTCPDKNTFGVTYDDGPGFDTPDLLEYLHDENITVTFFSIGSRLLEIPATGQTEYMLGHHIAVHTWSHPPLTTLTNEEIIAELGWTKKLMKDVFGVTPNMMRPPYGDIDDRVRAICQAMNLTPVIWTRYNATLTFDTGDFNVAGGGESASQVLANVEEIFSLAKTIDTGFLVLEHDLFTQTVELATGYILPDAIANGFTFKNVIECLNKPLKDAYIETNDNATNPFPTGTSGVTTLSPGAPGSAQATGGSSGSSSQSGVPGGARRTADISGAFMTMVGTCIAGVLGGALMLAL